MATVWNVCSSLPVVCAMGRLCQGERVSEQVSQAGPADSLSGAKPKYLSFFFFFFFAIMRFELRALGLLDSHSTL
jgi:hypothetical protein